MIEVGVKQLTKDLIYLQRQLPWSRCCSFPDRSGGLL